MSEPSGIDLLFDNASFKAISSIAPGAPILQQPKAKMTTNELINQAPEEGSVQNKPISNWDIFSDFVRKFVLSIFFTLKDIWNKPDDVPLFTHIKNSINKDDRKLYVGIFLIFVAVLFF